MRVVFLSPECHTPACATTVRILLQAGGASLVVWESSSPIGKHIAEAPVLAQIADLEDASGFPAARSAELRAFLDLCPEPIQSFVVLGGSDFRFDINNNFVVDSEIDPRFISVDPKEGIPESQLLSAARILIQPRR